MLKSCTPYAVRTSQRSVVLVVVMRPGPCGRMIGICPSGPAAFGLLNLTDATSIAGIGGVAAAGDCACCADMPPMDNTARADTAIANCRIIATMMARFRGEIA